MHWHLSFKKEEKSALQNGYGEMAERSKAAVLKTVRGQLL